jgi:hypothetical protein
LAITLALESFLIEIFVTKVCRVYMLWLPPLIFNPKTYKL